MPGPAPGACFAGPRSPWSPSPALARGRLLAPPPPRLIARLCSSLYSYYDGVRLLRLVHHRLRLLAFPMRACSVRPQAEPDTSRFPCKELPPMRGSSTAPGRTGARDNAPVHVAVHVAFRVSAHVGTRDDLVFAAQWLAYALPCRHSADSHGCQCTAWDPRGSLLPSLAVDLHHLLFAGFDPRTIHQDIHESIL